MPVGDWAKVLAWAVGFEAARTRTVTAALPAPSDDIAADQQQQAAQDGKPAQAEASAKSSGDLTAAAAGAVRGALRSADLSCMDLINYLASELRCSLRSHGHFGLVRCSGPGSSSGAS